MYTMPNSKAIAYPGLNAGASAHHGVIHGVPVKLLDRAAALREVPDGGAWRPLQGPTTCYEVLLRGG